MPYQVASPKVIAELVEAGYLNWAKRRDADAIKSALDKLRSRPVDIFGRPEEDQRSGPGGIGGPLCDAEAAPH
jgi:hypothetical protein